MLKSISFLLKVVFVWITLFGSLHTSCAQNALMKELNLDGEIYYFRGEKFSGIGFLKNSKGKFIAECSFKKGKRHGTRICYNSRGRILSKDKFKKGRGRFKTYYPNGHIKNEGILNNITKEGLWKYYDQRGGIKAKEFWSINSVGTLIWEKYFNKLGVIETEIIYENGKIKEEKFYDESGELFKTNTY